MVARIDVEASARASTPAITVSCWPASSAGTRILSLMASDIVTLMGNVRAIRNALIVREHGRVSYAPPPRGSRLRSTVDPAERRQPDAHDSVRDGGADRGE